MLSIHASVSERVGCASSAPDRDDQQLPTVIATAVHALTYPFVIAGSSIMLSAEKSYSHSRTRRNVRFPRAP